MTLLLDTQLILWLYSQPSRMPVRARQMLLDPANSLWYSPISVLEVRIKNAKGRSDFNVDCGALLTALRVSDITELLVTSDHAMQVGTLPPLHKDPFDRLLLAQAIVENITLLTTDGTLALYPSNVLNVG